MKDTFFSLPRFMNLCRKEMVENWRSNALRTVLLYGVMTVAMVWNGYFEYQSYFNNSQDPVWSFSLVLFIWSLWGFGCLSASFTMEKMKTKTSRIAILMLPATPFEKFFSRWMVSTVAFLLVFLISYKLADYTRVLIYTLAYPEKQMIAPVDLSHLVGDAQYYTLCSTYLQFVAIISGYFFIQSLFVLGSSVWPRNSFLKTFATGAITAMVYISVGAFLTKSLLYGKNIVFMSEVETFTTLIIGCVLFTCVNWVLAYFRFKESEIINRM